VADCTAAIDANPIVPLMIISPLNKVQVLFGLKKVGGDLLSDQSYVLLSPYGALCAPVEIDLADTLHSSFEFPGPSVDAFRAADSTAKIMALTIPQNPTTFKKRKIFALPPFVGANFLDMASECNFSFVRAWTQIRVRKSTARFWNHSERFGTSSCRSST
jgi:hypothetical protein